MQSLVRKIVKLLCLVGFALARYLPPSYYGLFPWGKQLRAFFARGLIDCGKHVNIETGSHFPPSKKLRLGNYSGIGIRAEINGVITIGDYVMMAPDVVIHTRNHEISDSHMPMCFQGFQEYESVVIEDDVWIGQRVIILPGVTIGKGSVIGAGAVVAKDVPPYSIAVGNPARVVKSRNPDDLSTIPH